MTVSKNINNPVGMGGGQRKRLSRAERQNNGPHRNLDRQGAADQKAELVRKMREKTGAADNAGQTRRRHRTELTHPRREAGTVQQLGPGRDARPGPRCPTAWPAPLSPGRPRGLGRRPPGNPYWAVVGRFAPAARPARVWP